MEANVCACVSACTVGSNRIRFAANAIAQANVHLHVCIYIQNAFSTFISHKCVHLNKENLFQSLYTNSNMKLYLHVCTYIHTPTSMCVRCSGEEYIYIYLHMYVCMFSQSALVTKWTRFIWHTLSA